MDKEKIRMVELAREMQDEKRLDDEARYSGGHLTEKELRRLYDRLYWEGGFVLWEDVEDERQRKLNSERRGKTSWLLILA
jgi:hypothetical protein